MKKLMRVTIILAMVAVLLGPALAGSFTAASPAVVPQLVDAACSNGYVLWADSLSGSDTLDWSGSDSYVTGKVHSNYSIMLGGSDNVINGMVSYVTYFDDGGDANMYPPPVQVSPATIPVSYDISAYQPGGAAAMAADQEGRYYYVDGDLKVSDSNVRLDGLYYVTGEVDLSGSDLYGMVTIVAQGQIELAGSDHDFTPYSDGLLLYSEKFGFEELAIKIGGSDSNLQGMIYAPSATIEASGSVNVFTGGLFGHRLKLNGSQLTITFYEGYCPSELSPLPDPALTISYATGAPGSVFTLSATNYPPNQTAVIKVNGHIVGTASTGANGALTLRLSTDYASEGYYVVTVAVNPVATVTFDLDVGEPVRVADAVGPLFAVPEGAALTLAVYLPLVVR